MTVSAALNRSDLSAIRWMGLIAFAAMVISLLITLTIEMLRGGGVDPMSNFRGGPSSFVLEDWFAFAVIAPTFFSGVFAHHLIVRFNGRGRLAVRWLAVTACAMLLALGVVLAVATIANPEAGFTQVLGSGIKPLAVGLGLVLLASLIAQSVGRHWTAFVFVPVLVIEIGLQVLNAAYKGWLGTAISDVVQSALIGDGLLGVQVGAGAPLMIFGMPMDLMGVPVLLLLVLGTLLLVHGLFQQQTSPRLFSADKAMRVLCIFSLFSFAALALIGFSLISNAGGILGGSAGGISAFQDTYYVTAFLIYASSIAILLLAAVWWLWVSKELTGVAIPRVLAFVFAVLMPLAQMLSFIPTQLHGWLTGPTRYVDDPEGGALYQTISTVGVSLLVIIMLAFAVTAIWQIVTGVYRRKRGLEDAVDENVQAKVFS